MDDPTNADLRSLEIRGNPQKEYSVVDRRKLLGAFASSVAQFEDRMNQIYRTIDHPDGWSRAPDYEIHEDGKVYRTISHRDGVSLVADYDICGNYLYPTSANSGHETTVPEFEIKLDGKIHRTEAIYLIVAVQQYMNFDSHKYGDFSAKFNHSSKARPSASWTWSSAYSCLDHGTTTAACAAQFRGLGVSVSTNQALLQVIESKDQLIAVLTIQLASHTQGTRERRANSYRVYQGNETDSSSADPALKPVAFSRWTWLLLVLIALGAAFAWAWLGGYVFGFTLRDSDLDFSTQEPFISATTHGGMSSFASGCAKPLLVKR